MVAITQHEYTELKRLCAFYKVQWEAGSKRNDVLKKLIKNWKVRFAISSTSLLAKKAKQAARNQRPNRIRPMISNGLADNNLAAMVMGALSARTSPSSVSTMNYMVRYACIAIFRTTHSKVMQSRIL